MSEPSDPAVRNAALTERFWDDLFRRDFDAVGAWFTHDGNYRDVPAPEDGAFGPAEVAARLRLGLAPLAGCRAVGSQRAANSLHSAAAQPRSLGQFCLCVRPLWILLPLHDDTKLKVPVVASIRMH